MRSYGAAVETEHELDKEGAERDRRCVGQDRHPTTAETLRLPPLNGHADQGFLALLPPATADAPEPTVPQSPATRVATGRAHEAVQGWTGWTGSVTVEQKSGNREPATVVVTSVTDGAVHVDSDWAKAVGAPY